MLQIIYFFSLYIYINMQIKKLLTLLFLLPVLAWGQQTTPLQDTTLFTGGQPTQPQWRTASINGYKSTQAAIGSTYRFFPDNKFIRAVYIPYTGATKDVLLGEYGISASGFGARGVSSSIGAAYFLRSTNTDITDDWSISSLRPTRKFRIAKPQGIVGGVNDTLIFDIDYITKVPKFYYPVETVTPLTSADNLQAATTAWVRAYVAAGTGTGFIQNQNSVDQSANFRISGNGILGGSLTTKGATITDVTYFNGLVGTFPGKQYIENQAGDLYISAAKSVNIGVNDGLGLSAPNALNINATRALMMVPQTIQRNGLITSTTTQGLMLENQTVATSGVPQQFPPTIMMQGTAWNTTTTLNNALRATISYRPINGATPASQMVWNFANNTAGTNTDVATLTSDGSFRVLSGFGNYTTVNNAGLFLNNTGTIINANKANSDVTLTVNNVNASGTGNVLNIQSAGSNKFGIGVDGVHYLNNTKLTANQFAGVNAAGTAMEAKSTTSFVDITTSQTIGGVKTFSAQPVFNSGFSTINSSSTIQNGSLYFLNSSSGFGISLASSGATGSDKTIQLPNESGVVALGYNLRLTGSGTGAATTISIAHGLTGITSSSIAIVMPINAASAGISYITTDATNVNIVYTVAPASGTNNLQYNLHIKP